MATGDETTSGRSLRSKRLRRGATVLTVGVVLGIVFVGGLLVSGVSPLFDGLTGPTHQVPFSADLRLDAETYNVFEETGSNSQSGPFSVRRFDSPTISLEQVRITGPDGAVVSVHRLSSGTSETLTRGSTIYSAVAQFHPPTKGSYQVSVDGRTGHRVIVARSIGSSFGSAAIWGLVGIPAGLLFVVGVTLTIVGLTTKEPRAGAVSAAQAPGWYPAGPGVVRYWDGAAWTDHTAPGP